MGRHGERGDIDVGILRILGTIPIRLYQWVISPMLPGVCNYHPTCSEYTRLAILRFGVLRGVVMGMMRVGRCSGRFYGGHDPVPEIFDIQRLKAEYPQRSVKKNRPPGEE